MNFLTFSMTVFYSISCIIRSVDLILDAQKIRKIQISCFLRCVLKNLFAKNFFFDCSSSTTQKLSEPGFLANKSFYSHLFNKRGGWNKRGGGAKVAKSLNVEAGINVEVGKFYEIDKRVGWNFFLCRVEFFKIGKRDVTFIREMRVEQVKLIFW